MVENLPANARDIETQIQSLGQGRSLGEGNGNPLQYPCLENPMDRGAWWATAHRVAELDMSQGINNNRQKFSHVTTFHLAYFNILSH